MTAAELYALLVALGCSGSPWCHFGAPVAGDMASVHEAHLDYHTAEARNHNVREQYDAW